MSTTFGPNLQNNYTTVGKCDFITWHQTILVHIVHQRIADGHISTDQLDKRQYQDPQCKQTL